MDRVQAMNLLKEIAFKIPELDPQAMSIVERESDNPIQIGCTIHFRGLSIDCIEKIKLIVKDYFLAILDSEIDLVIYTPSKKIITDGTKVL